MANKIASFFVRVWAGILAAGVLYILVAIVFPDFADTYGSKSINAKVRNIYNASLNLSDPSGNIRLPITP